MEELRILYLGSVVPIAEVADATRDCRGCEPVMGVPSDITGDYPNIVASGTTEFSLDKEPTSQPPEPELDGSWVMKEY